MKISSIKNLDLKKNRGNRKAFTLIELLVAMTVFAMFIGALASSYLFLTRAARDTNELRKLYSESRFLMDEMIEVARGASIAYDCYQPGNATCEGYTIDAFGESINGNVLAIIRPDGKRVVIKSEDACDSTGDPCVVLKKIVQEYNEGQNGWVPSNADGYYGPADNGFQNMNLEKLEVQNAYFVIKPAQPDPSVSPYVQIYLSLTGDSQIRDSISFDIQTTVSSRMP
ncbi:MAG: prepilin-type N-terminal cleavage/methylation domain-containing protein [Candidatus Peregrinibacteria bacterium]|nr:prepilin-type N-terminal cleavage/methylation domain-containing protein [Candidatus Peregrinibacteria bacterium]